MKHLKSFSQFESASLSYRNITDDVIFPLIRDYTVQTLKNPEVMDESASMYTREVNSALNDIRKGKPIQIQHKVNSALLNNAVADKVKSLTDQEFINYRDEILGVLTDTIYYNLQNVKLRPESVPALLADPTYYF